MRTVRKSIHLVGLAAAGLLAAAGAGVAEAQVMDADVGVNPTYLETLGGVSSTGGFFSARAFVTSAGDYSGGSLSYGGLPVAPLSYAPGDVAWEFSDSNSDFAALQTLYPPGDYVFSLLAGSQGATSIGINYAGGAYSNVPQITNFSALQGLDASKSFTVDFVPYVPGSVANASFIFFSITNSAGTVVYSTGGISDTTTSITIGAGTLAAGGSYSFDLLYSNRIDGSDYINGYPVTQFYDTHTDGSFTTAGAVPEPSTWAMLLMGFVGIGAMARRRAPAWARAALGRPARTGGRAWPSITAK
jgi:hypothetical protein